jgi:hypothetical protein
MGIISYNSALRSTRMRAVIAALDAAPIPGVIEIGTAGMAAVLVDIPLAKPSFNEANGTITMNGVPRNGIAAATGTAINARLKDGNGAVVVSGLTIGTVPGGVEIILNSLAVTAGQVITLSSGTISHSP